MKEYWVPKRRDGSYFTPKRAYAARSWFRAKQAAWGDTGDEVDWERHAKLEDIEGEVVVVEVDERSALEKLAEERQVQTNLLMSLLAQKNSKKRVSQV